MNAVEHGPRRVRESNYVSTQATVTPSAYALDDALSAGLLAVPIVTFDDLLTRHQTEIFRYCLQMTRNRADADDLYQETLIKAYRAFGRLDGAANHRAWLYKIATNTFLSGRRRAGR